jgi:glycosyltransferase involved in cell wall biosynthesis
MSTGGPKGDRPRGLLLFAMYDVRGLDSAPKVRISMMTAALARQVPLEEIGGGRRARAIASVRWLAGGGLHRVGAVYVESATSTATPADIVFLALMRLVGRPVGVYFRDAYQLFRDTYPITRRRQKLMDVLWRLTMPIMRRIATHHFVQSHGLATVLGLRDPILLPPGTDTDAPDLGAGASATVAYVGSLGWADGFDRLLEAMRIVRGRVPSADLLVVGPAAQAVRLVELPQWVQMHEAGRTDLPGLLREARLCVIPRPITEYTNMVVPVKLWDYLSFGKPIVATGTRETEAVLRATGAAIVTGDSPEALAEGMLVLLQDKARAEELARHARAFAESPVATWDARASTVLATLGMEPVT